MTTADATLPALECVDEPDRARALLRPLRLQVLARAARPRSAADIAAALDLPRQKVNYHVKELHRAGFLRPAGRRRKRNLTEQRYVATARSYVLSPALLGPLECRPVDDDDALSAACLIAAGTRLVSETARAAAAAKEAGKRLSTLTMTADVRFESAAQRERFAEALGRAVADVVARHTSPAVRDDEKPAKGRPFRLTVGCHPVPPDAPAAPPPSRPSAPRKEPS
ncbi:MAG: helix-turn-helix domain-containing protein [Planctomycetota bacterium JB042]